MKNSTFFLPAEVVDDVDLKESLKKLVLERMKIMPDSTSLSVGSESFTKAALLSHVREGDELGEQIMAMELEFLQDMASGAIYKNEESLNSHN